MPTAEAVDHKVVSHKDWIKARTEFLKSEKEFTQAREVMAQRLRELPWEKVEKEYVFEGEKGKVTLAELFEGNSQLVVYHFMFGPDWKEGCHGCSFTADHIDGPNQHLRHHDVTLICISQAPYSKLAEYKKRMGWRFPWVSSEGSDFNYDYGVSFTPEHIERGGNYNFGTARFGSEEAPGISVFYRDEAGNIFHTYSCYSRGLDMMNAAYHYLDLTPLGRHEEGLPYPMDWVRLRDQYQPAPVQASCCHS